MDWSKLFDRIGPALPNTWEALAIVAGVAFLVWVTLRLRAWFRDDAAGDDCTIDLLSDLRELHQQGGLSEEEFRSIKTRLAQAATRGGASRTKPVLKPSPPVISAEPAASHSLHGRSDPPGQDSTGPTATDAAERAQDAPRVDTP